MNRYQFEDAISAYLDNELSLPQRKEFDAYLEANPEARDMVNSVQKTIRSIRALPAISASPAFMSELRRRIEFEKNRPVRKAVRNHPHSILGFTPLYAGIMSALVVAFIFVGLELTNDGGQATSSQPEFTNFVLPESLPTQPEEILPANTALFAETEEDSTDTLQDTPQKRYKLKDRMRLVKDQR